MVCESALTDAPGRRNLGETEIQNLSAPALGDENIRGLDVAMNNSLRMGCVEGVGHIDCDGQQAVHLDRPHADHMFQRGAFEVLHRNEGLAFMLSDFVDRTNIGMIQGRRRACLAAETFERRLVVGNIVGKKFQGDEAAEFGVFGFENHAHAATAELFENAVVRDGASDHSREVYAGGWDKSMERTCAVPSCGTRDPSLRLKGGSVRDDSLGMGHRPRDIAQRKRHGARPCLIRQN